MFIYFIMLLYHFHQVLLTGPSAAKVQQMWLFLHQCLLRSEISLKLNVSLQYFYQKINIYIQRRTQSLKKRAGAEKFAAIYGYTTVCMFFISNTSLQISSLSVKRYDEITNELNRVVNTVEKLPFSWFIILILRILLNIFPKF